MNPSARAVLTLGDRPAALDTVARAHAWARRNLRHTKRVAVSNGELPVPVGAYRGRFGAITVNSVHRHGDRLLELLVAEPHRKLRISVLGPDETPQRIYELMPQRGESVGVRVGLGGLTTWYTPGFPPLVPDAPISRERALEDLAAAGGRVVLGGQVPRELLRVLRWAAADPAGASFVGFAR